jgi:uncharacterized protein YegP (UPF0339 family)
MTHNDYLSCEAYQNQPLDANNEGFVTFFEDATKSYFFALTEVATATVLFRSEAYPTEAARKTGIAAVIKNKPEAKRYSVVAEGGQYLVILKAGNHKEIARSCPFASEAEATAFIAAVTTDKPVATKATQGKASANTKSATANVTNISTKEAIAETVTPAKKAVEKVATAEAAPIQKATVVKVATPQKVSTTKATAKTVALKLADVDTYIGHDTLTDEYGKTGFALFTANQKHYFAVYNADGSVFQASAGFDTVEVRDNVFSSVKQVITNENAYQVIKEEEKYAVVLKDENDAILSRSLDFNTFTEAHLRTPAGWYQPTEVVGTMY